jgi:hypothetical protein
MNVQAGPPVALHETIMPFPRARRRAIMLYAILCYNDEDVVWSWT